MHPRAHGADNRFLTRHTSCLGSSPCIRGRFLSIPIGPERCGFIPARGGRFNSRIMSHATIRFIPVRTGQMQFCFHLTAVRTAHPRTYGADTKSSKKSSGSMDKRFLLSRLPTIKSVCIISFRYIFADNTFWSKNRRIQNPSAIQKISSSGQCIRLFTQKQGVAGEHPYFNVQNKKNWIPASCLKSILIP